MKVSEIRTNEGSRFMIKNSTKYTLKSTK